jgi:hypothetical protein
VSYLTPDQVRLRAALATAQEQNATALRTVAGDGLSAGQAQQLLEQVRAWRGPNAFALQRYLASRPDALTAPAPDCPMPAVRLLAALTAAGYGARVTLVGCADCGRTSPVPRRTGPAGRLCDGCADRRRPRVPCARCGAAAAVEARRPEGGICAACHKRDPATRRQCGGCHRMMYPARHLPDGSYRCQACAPKNRQRCCRCDRVRRVNAWTPQGPVCGTCYQSPARRCGVCGQVAPIMHRARGSTPDTCFRCAKRKVRTCYACGNRGRGRRIHGGRGPFHCDACAPDEAVPGEVRPCSLCSAPRPVAALFPLGPVCGRCYRATRRTPEPCAGCGRHRALVGRAEDGDGLCIACCFPGEPSARCSACAGPADLMPGGRCPRCTAAALVTELLAAGEPHVPAPLRPLAAVLAGADNPYTVLAWLRGSSSARLLGRLAANPATLTHEHLDTLPRMISTAYVRGLLVTAGLLPPRDENLARLVSWSARTLATLTPQDATIVRPFADWHVIRDARRRSAAGRYTYAAYKGDCSDIRAAIALLAWLDTKQVTLSALQQPHLDTWAADRPSLRSCAVPFVRWACARHLTAAPLTLRHPASQLAANFDAEDVHARQLRRCLNDPSLPPEVRITGALVRLYALPLTKIVELTSDQLGHDASHTYLTIRSHPVLLPPKLAQLISDYQQRHTPGQHGEQHPRYLLPGQHPGQPRNPAGLADAMRRHGLPARSARNTAMIQALADLPPPLIADLIGIHPATAERWSVLAAERWSEYVGSRP